MCQTKIATFEHYFQLLSNLKIIIIQRRRNIWVFLNFYSRFNHFPARAFAWLSVQSFRLLSRAPPSLSPDLLPACSPLLFFRFSRFSANLINTRATRSYRALARGKHIYSNVFVRPSKTTWAFCRSIIKKPRNVVGVFVIWFLAVRRGRSRRGWRLFRRSERRRWEKRQPIPRRISCVSRRWTVWKLPY